VTGDTGVADDERFIRLVGCDDDVITSASYRIPGPIEDGLLRHPVVRMVAVVGTPDRHRTGTVTAFVMLNGSYAA
jgi:acetyl-CoA synthetase